jgi:hypothetical protein
MTFSQRRPDGVARVGRRAALAALLVAGGAPALHAQDLAPRAYVITPLGSNAITAAYTYNTGELLFEGTVPIEDATGKLSVPMLTYYRSFGLFGRSANVLAALPYGVGTFEGRVFEQERSVYRSGLFDSVVRVSVNFVGGEAMSLAQMRERKWRQKTLLGVSLKVVAPTGQYDPTKLINLGSNRWTFKPELGLARAWGHWELDAYGSVFLFTENPEFFSNNPDLNTGTQAQTQDPIGAVELHFSYDVRPRLWVSLDGNFWYGGKTSLNGVENPKTLQKNSRVGLTASVPITRHQSLKVSYAQGAYIRFGGDYKIFSAAWQYAWIDRPK